MARFVLLAEFGMLLLGNRGRKWHWDCCCLGCLLLALFHDRLEETTENVDSVAFTNTRQARMVGKRFVQIVSNIPPHAEPISRMAHELPFGPDTLEEHDQL